MIHKLALPVLPLLAACTGDDTGGGTTDDTGQAPDPILLLEPTALTADQLAIVVNTDDALSPEVAAAYAQARNIDESRILSVSLGTSGSVDADTFQGAYDLVYANLDEDVQALLLAFTTPYIVDCMGTSAAFALGFDDAYCSTPCSTTKASDYYDSDSIAPWTDLAMRPAMMLSAPTIEQAQAYIDRGLSADDTNPTGDGWLVRTTDSARSVRYPDFQDAIDLFDADALALNYVDNANGSGSDVITGQVDVMFYLTGLTSVSDIDTNTFRPGGLADHLTSYGGLLSDSNGQMPITEWLAGGATASYGTALEPCNYTQKFPEASVLLPRYYRGGTAIEAYWKSVNWPGEGNFVGDPLARPWGPTWSWADGTLTIATTSLGRDTDWVVEGAQSEDGPWDAVVDDIRTDDRWAPTVITVEDAWLPYYRVIED